MSEIDSSIKLDAMRRLVKALETVDVVPVVRCKNCKYWNTNAIGICNLHDIRPTPIIMDDWFCADGERRNENEN